MRCGGDSRGSSYARRRRKLELFERDGGRCVHCDRELTLDTLTQDRIVPGGPYVLANLQSACFGCNRARSNKLVWTPPRAALAAA